ncbi:flagellar basal-body MS-ring/collar protein FliF [Pelagicoccus sp. SDUM812002]|uniref:flagellar basal-body MS-ring/collar protein FliF n=1 Tax=Pelagicoccus sp. SDUM812002 TaxID=3041266 RepID=UPI0028103E08|nr:flagellar basal-body MS-ring/collar protein FliF [Pelagicoccus sp. SDUM812002]MDQ8185939.1 flagellar basal-body MS-ring/collar protein FliF [Pelagicoccus sp. SDUM812002]
MGKQFKEIWQSLGANQRISLILASGLVVLAMIGMMIWAAQPDMQLLYGKLSPEEAGKIVAKLEQKGIKFETGAGGNSIYVESKQVHRLRMELATEGIPAGGSGPGFELFDEGSFGISDFVQRTNFLRAVQGELSRTISQFDGIESARVMVVMPENRLLSRSEGQDRPTASVFVDGGGLTASTVNSIRHLVANAIQRLNVNDVVVVDSMGTVLSEELRSDGLGGGMSSDVMKYRKSMESYFTTKVQSMLDRVLGPNQSEVRVAVDIDTASVQTTEKIYDPESQVARSTQSDEDSQIERETSGDGSNSAAGITANNPGNGAAAGTFSTIKEREDKNKTRTENFEINERVVSSVQNPGSIKRLSASLVVAKRMKDVGGTMDLVERTPEEMEELTDIVLTALGIQLEPGQQATDFVTVKEMAFAADPFENHGELLEEEANFQRYFEMGKNGVGAILGIGVILFFMQMLKRYKPEKISIEVLQPDQMLETRKMEDTSVVTPEMLNELIRQKPANIGVSLREWIGEEVKKK